jgi:hypothetical protein
VFFDPSFAQQSMQRAQGRGRLRDEQAPAGVAVKPVNEFQWLARAQGAQRLDDPESQADPPCTATPAGLFNARICRSSYTTASRTWACRASGTRAGIVVVGDASRSGGRRTSSSADRR